MDLRQLTTGLGELALPLAGMVDPRSRPRFYPPRGPAAPTFPICPALAGGRRYPARLYAVAIDGIALQADGFKLRAGASQPRENKMIHGFCFFQIPAVAIFRDPRDQNTP
ncbi:MAG: hypothetical protein RIQ93_538 [Verrucomicrobiota bacterium]